MKIKHRIVCGLLHLRSELSWYFSTRLNTDWMLHSNFISNWTDWLHAMQSFYSTAVFYCNSLFYSKYWGWDISTSPSGYGGDCPEGVPVEFGLLSILAAFGAAFGILYMALTIKLGGRRKRQATGLSDSMSSCDAQAGSISGYYGCHLNNFVFGGEDGTYWQQAADLLWHGECWAQFLQSDSIETQHRKLKQ